MATIRSIGASDDPRRCLDRDRSEITSRGTAEDAFLRSVLSRQQLAALGIQRGGFRGSRKQWLGGAALLRGPSASAARAAAAAATAASAATTAALPDANADVFRRANLGREGDRSRAAATSRRPRLCSLRVGG